MSNNQAIAVLAGRAGCPQHADATHHFRRNSDPLETPSAEVLPFVSVIMPVYNEERYIAQNLEEVLAQDYPADRMEIIVADGLSSDRTPEIVRSLQARHPNIRLIGNPNRIVPCALNRALACAEGEIIVRLDGHCEYPRDYIRRVVTLRQQTEADNLGGVLAPTGETYVQKCIGAAFFSPVGVGGPALKAEDSASVLREVDAVHGGCWRRARLMEVGGFDEEMVRNQDDELSFRLRKKGGKIMQDTGIQVRYHVRNSFAKLFLQFMQYGYWKVRVVQRHPTQASLRHFIPSVFVLTLLLAALASIFSPEARWCGAGLAGAYLASLSVVTLRQIFSLGLKLWPGTILALILMHIGYGTGFILGWLRVWCGPLPSDAIFERVTR